MKKLLRVRRLEKKDWDQIKFKACIDWFKNECNFLYLDEALIIIAVVVGLGLMVSIGAGVGIAVRSKSIEQKTNKIDEPKGGPKPGPKRNKISNSKPKGKKNKSQEKKQLGSFKLNNKGTIVLLSSQVKSIETSWNYTVLLYSSRFKRHENLKIKQLQRMQSSKLLSRAKWIKLVLQLITQPSLLQQHKQEVRRQLSSQQLLWLQPAFSWLTVSFK